MYLVTLAFAEVFVGGEGKPNMEKKIEKRPSHREDGEQWPPH